MPTTWHITFYDGPCGGQKRTLRTTGDAPKRLRCGGASYRFKEGVSGYLIYVQVGGLNDTPADKPLQLPEVIRGVRDPARAWRRLMGTLSRGTHRRNQRIWRANARIRRRVR